ncbi:hypothetical protein MMC07_005506 [Pseudocyphellaria aurata]|nr:hypothetical protein [Pseudocyphellaria aurata]
MAFFLATLNFFSFESTGLKTAAFSLPLNFWAQVFIVIFLFRYVRLLVNLIAFLTFVSVPIPQEPTLSADDVTVIVPSVEPYGEIFEECIQSLLQTNPAEIVVVTVNKNLARAISTCKCQSPAIRVLSIEVANKREQVKTPITVLCDDSVFWPRDFLRHVLAPFEDQQVGVVGTCKRVRRTVQNISLAGFWNFIGAIYLERNNFEAAAMNHMDGGVPVVSGRTSAHRTSILQDPDFIHGFLNESIFFGLVGPLSVDDDNFITRWMVNHGWKIRIQYSDGARMETVLGKYPKFLLQCLRWSRTTWRSNPVSLFRDRTVWRTQPWCVYAVYFTSFVNFALFYDSALFFTLWLAFHSSTDHHHRLDQGRQNVAWTYLGYLGIWIFLSKLVKPFPHFWRRPQDLIYLPGYVLFGYFHTFLKLYAMCTFWNTTWSGRPGVVGPSKDTVGIVRMRMWTETLVKSRPVLWRLITLFLFVTIVMSMVGITRDTWTTALDAVVHSLLIMLVGWATVATMDHDRSDADIDADNDEEIDEENMDHAGTVGGGGGAGSAGKGLTRP